MYLTTLKNVQGGFATGSNGEQLHTVAPFPLRAGMQVWTDGKIIFGFSRPNIIGTGFVFPENGGLPVLCDNRKGYFTKKGVWKNYPVAENDFIVNNSKIFFGGDYLCRFDYIV